MSVEVLGISTSPRVDGNSDILLRRALAGAESAGAHVEYVRLSDHSIGPCIECNACYETGKCDIRDDYQQILEKMLRADRLIFATPIFFMGVCAQAKALIDRCQCLWAHKCVLNKKLVGAERDRRAMVIAVGGSRSKKMFEGIRMTMKSFFDVLDICYAAGLFVNQVDGLDEIEEHPSALKEAYRLGSRLVNADTLPSDKPINIELT